MDREMQTGKPVGQLRKRTRKKNQKGCSKKQTASWTQGEGAKKNCRGDSRHKIKDKKKKTSVPSQKKRKAGRRKTRAKKKRGESWKSQKWNGGPQLAGRRLRPARRAYGAERTGEKQAEKGPGLPGRLRGKSGKKKKKKKAKAGGPAGRYWGKRGKGESAERDEHINGKNRAGSVRTNASPNPQKRVPRGGKGPH